MLKLLIANNVQPVKKVVMIVLATSCAIIAVAFAIVIFWDYNRVVYINSTELLNMAIQQGTSETAGEIRFSIDSIEQSEKYVVIQGWMLKNGENMAIVNNQVLLRDTVYGTYMKIGTKMIKRVDLDEAFGSEHQYYNGGFYAIVSKRHLTDHPYEICLLYRSNIGEGNYPFGISNIDHVRGVDDLISTNNSNNILVLSGAIFESGDI